MWSWLVAIALLLGICGLPVANASFPGPGTQGSGLYGHIQDPRMIADLTLWLRPNQGVTQDTTGGTTTASAWANQAASGNTYNFAQGTKANQPVYGSITLNGYSGLTFDGVNDYLSINARGLGLLKNRSSYTVIAVTRLPAATTSQRLLTVSNGLNAGSARFGAEVQATNRLAISARRLDADSAVSPSTGDNTYTTAENACVTWRVDHSATLLQIFKNGNSVLNNAAFLSSGSTSNTDSLEIRIGQSGNGTLPFAGTLYELLIYTHSLTAVERQQVEHYLGSKYQIAVASTIPIGAYAIAVDFLKVWRAA